MAIVWLGYSDLIQPADSLKGGRQLLFSAAPLHVNNFPCLEASRRSVRDDNGHV